MGEDIINFAVNINLDNQAMPGMEGFTAGISGNALHYVIQTAKYCQSVNIPFNFEQTLEVCRDHLVGDSIQQPMHHSLPEVMQGAYIAKMLIDKGVISEKGSQMNQEQMLGALQGAVAEANDKVRILQQTVYAYA
ncbi:hypothetical protein BUE93_21235 [Chromobacterium amazonense]|uniref:Uncharacterized protein n=1 Tax=Chromobacterium amazonense TaxID=1382803 RepID=A0A2S9WZ21_9NEIS|nr:hypothetical protein BUE93_21235 [Chromobacterium amazonense]